MKIESRMMRVGLMTIGLVAMAQWGWAAVYYVGGNDPGSGADWRAGTWTNFVIQVGKLSTSGDVLRIAGTITRPGSTGNTYLDVPGTGVSLLGGWDGLAGGWTRLSLESTNNLAVIDGGLQGNMLMVSGTNVTLEGLWLKRGSHGGDALRRGTGLLISGSGAQVLSCRFTDGNYMGVGVGDLAALYIEGSNTLVRKTYFTDNLGCGVNHLLVAPGAGNTRVTECRFTAGAASGGSSICLYQSGLNGTNLCCIDNSTIFNDRPVFFRMGSSVLIHVTMHGTGIDYQDSGDNLIYIRNSIVSETGNWTLRPMSAGGQKVKIDDSLMDNLVWLTGQGGVTVDADSLDIDAPNPPAFMDVSSGNLQLGKTSVAVGRGSTNWLSQTYQGTVLGLAPGQQTDLAGILRIQGRTVDMGAFERVYRPAGTVLRLQ